MWQEREALRAIQPYVAGKPIDDVKKRFKRNDVIKLASNENPLGCSPKAQAAIRKAAKGVAVYPPMQYQGLREKLAAFYGLNVDQVVLGNGSDELMMLAAQIFVEPGDEVILSRSTFSTYEMVTRLAGGTPVWVDLQEGRYDLAGMLRSVTERTRLIYLCNPNNPTGGMFTEPAFRDFIEALPDRIVVVLDEAYGEYVTSPDFPRSVEWIQQKKNLIVLRTFSKVYGLASLRVGYGLADPRLIHWFHNVVRLPFNVNGMGEVVAIAALGDQAFVRKSLNNNSAGKQLLFEGLRALGYEPLPTEANFLFFEMGGSADQMMETLMAEGIIVRALTSVGFPSAIRVTIGTPAQNRKFLTALKKVRRSSS